MDSVEAFARATTGLHSWSLIEYSEESLYYLAPIMNLYPIWCLINRVEIKLRGLERESFKDYYTEFDGVSQHTI